MEWFLIYLLVMCEQIRDAAAYYPGWIFFGGVACCFLIFALALASTDMTKESHAKWVKTAKRWAFVYWMFTATLALTHTFLPTQKNMAIIIGAGVTYSAVTSETGQRIGGKAIQLLEQKINDALEDKPSGKEEGKEEEIPTKKSGSKVPSQAT